MVTAPKEPRYRVADGTQVHHAGTTYDSGAKLPVGLPPQIVQFWLDAGWIQPTS